MIASTSSLTPLSNAADPSSSTPAAAVARSARGRPSDDVETRHSKSLSYILRHGATKEGLVLRDDGFVRVDLLLKRPKLKGLDFTLLSKIVAENAKQRFSLRQEPSSEGGSDEMEWWIRANQGHSIVVEKLELIKIARADEVPVVVHGTYRKNWESIAKEGLKVMTRNHLHCAAGLLGEAGVTSGMRASCDIFIYLDVPLLFQDGIDLFRSANDVILTSGLDGVIAPKYFLKVVMKDSGEILPIP